MVDLSRKLRTLRVMSDTAVLISAFVTLFVIVDPIALAPMFIALTRGTSAAHRRVVALRGCAIGAALLTVFGLAGERILTVIGITMPAFQIAGGILLFLTALDMLFERRTQRRAGNAGAVDDPSVFPLAMPFIAGPGAMTSMILLVSEAPDWGGVLAVHLVMLAVVAIAFALFMVAAPLERALGHTGTMVVTRLLGMLLAALSVQFVLNGALDAGIM